MGCSLLVDFYATKWSLKYLIYCYIRIQMIQIIYSKNREFIKLLWKPLFLLIQTCWVYLQSGHSDLFQFLLRFLNGVTPEMLEKALHKGYLSREYPVFLWKIKLMKVNFILAATVMQRERNTGFDRESAKINFLVHSLTFGLNLPSLQIVYFDLQCDSAIMWKVS